MKYDPEIHHRRSIRLRDYDYSANGAYFITICVQGRECLFGEIVDGEMRQNESGEVVQAVWERLPVRFSGVETDAAIIMPNHFHGIICIAGHVGAQFIAPKIAPKTDGEADGKGIMNLGAIKPGAMNPGAMNRAPTLGEIVRTFKAASTRLIRKNHLSGFAWQRNYYERVIRDDGELLRARQYIEENPLKWKMDKDNPDCQTPA